ncbi:MAG: nucleotidyltransferase substrate binding protein [Kiloniellaceae bacterium]
MERLRERLKVADKALSTLAEIETLGLPKQAERDAKIMRFVYTTEAVWRALQRYLLVVEGIDLGTPKSCMRGARDAGLLTSEQTKRALAMIDDRNLTVHTYNETLAQQIAARIPGHLEAMKSLLAAMWTRVQGC